MPKFMTYQRPAPVNRGNWNATPGRKPVLPIKAPQQAKKVEAPTLSLPELEQLLRGK